METSKPVVVKHVPQRLSSKQARSFLLEIQPILSSDRPQLVFDCSQVLQIDAGGVETLLQCLGEVIKRDGDLKLAAVPASMSLILEMTRTERLFEIYETATDAVLSFSRFLPGSLRLHSVAPMPGSLHHGPAGGHFDQAA